MATAPEPQPLLTAEEFARRPDPGFPEELLKGRVVAMPPPGIRHGWITAEFLFLLRTSLQAQDIGRLVAESGMITQRGPDTVRGPDLSFYSYARLPRTFSLPDAYHDVAPDLVVEVLSPNDRWPNVLAKVAELLSAGVLTVCVVDPDRRNVHLYQADEPVRVLGEGEELTFPAILPGFAVRVGRLFEPR